MFKLLFLLPLIINLVTAQLPYIVPSGLVSGELLPVRIVFLSSEISGIILRFNASRLMSLGESAEAKCRDLVIDSSGGFPGISECEGFSQNSVLLRFQHPLSALKQVYSLTLLLTLPSPSEPNFWSLSFLDSNDTVSSPPYEGLLVTPWITSNIDLQGEFRILSQSSDQINAYSTMVFSVAWFGGSLDSSFFIDVVALPSDVWSMGALPGTPCAGYDQLSLGPGTFCKYMNFRGALLPNQTNGFRIRIGETSNSGQQFMITALNPSRGVNSVWVATLASSSVGSSLIMSNAPVLVSGTVVGEIFDFSFPVAGAKQSVSLSFFPGNTLLSGGSVTVIPPPEFSVIEESPESVERFNSVSGEWSSDGLNNQWILITDSPIFHDTLYAVKLFIANPPDPQPAFSWTIVIKDASGRDVSSSRNVRGLNIFGSLLCGISPSSLLAGAVQTVTFSVKYGQSALSQSSSIRVYVPATVDFVLGRGGCGETFRMIEGPSRTSSVLCTEGKFKIDFPIGTSILAGTSVIFSMQFKNPSSATSSIGTNEWKFETLLFQGSVQDWGKVDNFVIYPHNFQFLTVSPARRFSGSQQINLLFTPSHPLYTNDFIRFTAPLGFSWETSSSSHPIFSSKNNQLVLLITGPALNPGVAYSKSFQVNIPTTSQKFANRWTIEHYRLLGGETRIQALSVEGFQTQSIVDISVTAYDMSANSWNNFAVIIFTPTSSVDKDGFLEISATLPTLLCPPRALEGNEYFAMIPLDISDRTYFESSECTTRESKGISVARLVLRREIDAKKKYYFVISLLNPPTAPPVDSNRFVLSTFSPSGIVIETGSVAGFSLNKPMVNSMYVASLNQDRRAGVLNPATSFQISFSEPCSAGSSLEILAPFNVSLCPDGPGTACVVEQNFFNTTSSCTCALTSRATVSLPVAVAPGSYGMTILSVRNPISTPVWNYWKFFVFDSAGTIRQSAVWVSGYSIQNILNVSIKDWNPTNAVVGQTVVNPIELFFETSTSIPAGGLIQVKVRPGFVAPLDACSLFPTSINAGAVPALPEGTSCSGDSKSTIKIFIPRPAPPGSYGIRFYVNNPSTVSVSVDYWSIVSTSSSGVLIDAAYEIPGFPVVQRVEYFQVSPSSLTGNTSNTFLRIIFALSKNLSPGKFLSVSAPKGFSFLLASCGETNPPNHLLTENSISGITALPDFVACAVNSSSVVVLTNTQLVRHGKPLPSSVPFVFYISNVQTPISTPEMNLWTIKADAEMGVGSGFKIQPKLTSVSVSSSNPGFGLSTLFTFIFTTVSPIDSGGTITITPPESGYNFIPSSCAIPKKSSFCPFEFTACALNNASDICNQYRIACISSELNLSSTRILYCTASTILTIQTGSGVTIPPGTDLVFTVSGFNSRNPASGEGGHHWIIETRNSFSGSVPVDRALVDPFPLFGVVHVESLRPTSQKVSASSNEVEISLYLSSPLPAPARIDVTFPRAFSDNIALIMKEVKLSGAFPAYCQWKLVVSSLSVRIDCPNDLVPSNRVLKLSLTISNPQITPPDNLWGITGYSATSVVNVNLRIPGFSVYGEFDSADVAGRVLGPNSVNTVGISFTLASKLICDSTNPDCFLNIMFPSGYIPIDASCGSGIFSTTYSRYEGADSQFPLHSSFLSIPHGSFCSSKIVNNSSLLISVQIDSDLTSGILYAFQVGVINPSKTSVSNVFAFTTTVGGAELHRTETVPGLVMRELAVFEIDPSNPTKAQNNYIRFSIQSVKSIPPGSTISITAPIGFIFTCNLMGFISLTSTTKCVSSQNLLYLTSDKSLTIGPNTPIQFTANSRNPHWTPQTNVWSIQIRTSSGVTVDVKTNAPGFDVTGILNASIAAPFTYVKQKTLLTISFSPSTVQSRAITGNSIVLVGPSGYYFSSKCDGVSLRAISSNLANYPVPPSYVFPTSSLLCSGFENETVSVGFATGYALHMFNYELTISVVNSNKSSSNTQWTVLTRGLDLITGTLHILDYNASIPGYPLAEQITD